MKEFLSNKYVVVTLRVLLGLIFIYSSIGKLFNPADFAKAILRYDFLPIYFVNLLAIVLPWLEFIVGLLLISGVYKKASALLAGASLVMFLIALISASVRGLDISCGCFSLEESSSKGDIIFRIIQDFFMLAAVIIVYKFGEDKKNEASGISASVTN